MPITLGPATKHGYEFKGWFKEAEFKNEVTKIEEVGNITLYAKFTALTQRTITYNLDGGVNSESNPANFTSDDLPLLLHPATKDGYTFDGWFKEAGFVTGIAEITDDANITIYAKFTLND